MYKESCKYEQIVADIAEVEALRDTVRKDAFALLERRASTLASMAVYTFGTRDRAANWMCLRQRCLDGKSAYQLLAEGDVDRVWDLMTGAESADSARAEVDSGER
ncbi:DUF2384 domain-containing protein [Dyella humicola]|uniref:DUF2384 domain-containing protein n=1 Tax=Dyella humicola TaxID=2992126 RepID=UPI0022574164|nr:DUF2384 domain-containing protein [Dyella humicola]